MTSSKSITQTEDNVSQIESKKQDSKNLKEMPQSWMLCLRSQSWQRLINETNVLYPEEAARSMMDYVWVPVEDNLIVQSVVKAKKFHGPLLQGLSNNEGAVFTQHRVSISNVKLLLLAIT